MLLIGASYKNACWQVRKTDVILNQTILLIVKFLPPTIRRGHRSSQQSHSRVTRVIKVTTHRCTGLKPWALKRLMSLQAEFPSFSKFSKLMWMMTDPGRRPSPNPKRAAWFGHAAAPFPFGNMNKMRHKLLPRSIRSSLKRERETSEKCVQLSP